jgi:hypothetical protein
LQRKCGLSHEAVIGSRYKMPVCIKRNYIF